MDGYTSATFSLWAGIGVAAATLAAMEGFAYAMHRWVMHGPMWFLHASHHRPRSGTFEANDWFAVLFALPSVFLVFLGTQLGFHPALTWVGIGIILYGAAYFLFHDVLVHRRVGHRWPVRGRYLRRIVQAHRLHHAVQAKEGTVSFGFLYAPPVATLRRQLRATGALRGSRARGAAADRASAGSG